LSELVSQEREWLWYEKDGFCGKVKHVQSRTMAQWWVKFNTELYRMPRKKERQKEKMEKRSPEKHITRHQEKEGRAHTAENKLKHRKRRPNEVSENMPTGDTEEKATRALEEGKLKTLVGRGEEIDPRLVRW